MQTSRTQDLTSGSITQSMLNLAYPLILGNLLQQGYNIADTFIIGKTLGAKALAAVGSSYTLMVFITSIFIGLCMGCSALFSMRYGALYTRYYHPHANSTGVAGYDLRLPENHFYGNLVCLSL